MDVDDDEYPLGSLCPGGCNPLCLRPFMDQTLFSEGFWHFLAGGHPNWPVATVALAGLVAAMIVLALSLSRIRAPGLAGGIGLLIGIPLACAAIGMLIWAMDPLDNMGR